MPNALRYALLSLLVVLCVAAGAWWARPATAPAPVTAARHSYSQALSQAHQGQPGAARVLYQQLARTDLAPDRRARLYAELPHYPSDRALALAKADLLEGNLLVRHAAIDAVSALAGSRRAKWLGPLLDDPQADVRYHAAREMMALAPDDLGVYFGPLQAVLDDYVNTLEREHDRPRSQAQLARIYLHDGDYDQAMAAIDRVLAQTPGDLEAVVMKARVLDLQGQPDKARAVLAEPLKRQPDSAYMQHELGRWLLAHHQEEYALLALSRAVELEPETSDYRYDLAVALHGLDQQDAAQGQLDELLRRDPANRRARLTLIDYWKQSGQLQNVQVLLAELERMNPDDPALQQGL